MSCKTIKVKYFDKEFKELNKLDIGDWIDLCTAENISFEPGEFKLVPLGVGMILPEGFEAHIVPRSSLFKNTGLLMTNSVGIIDNSYSGDNDEWKFPAYATRQTSLFKGERIAQFRIMRSQPEIKFVTVEHLNEKSRGGFGSTGKK